ncbi:MAG: hypothetical protein M9949_09110 [Candidatus Kapabacteria bacterium]|nr:hypothetical protein [Candidatus Kapabacteria bacterium]
MKISFKNGNNIEILKISNLKKEYYEYFKRVVFDLSIEFEFFKVETTLDGEESDFLNLKKCLEKLYDGEWKSFYFEPIGNSFQMHFELQENGQIKVHSKLYNAMFTGMLEFEYLTNQTFLPELIKEIDTVMNSGQSASY